MKLQNWSEARSNVVPSLKKKVIVITGASSGIGEATARRCATQGARLVLVARSAEKLEALAQQVRGLGGDALVVPTDVSCAEQIQQLANTVLSHYGHVDVLVNNAGFGLLDSFPQADIADLQAMVAVNVYGVVRCTQAFLPGILARRKGQIINVASLAGLLATPNFAFYSATKFALIGMSRSLQLDLCGTGVRCAIICPGATRTPFMVRAEESKYGRVTRLIPWLEADDVARVILRVVQKNKSGEIVVPAIAAPLIYLASALPGVAHWVIRLLR
jgi:hypothetical protein